MTELRHCPTCGAEVPVDAPHGVCPKCLLQAGLPSECQPTGDPADERSGDTESDAARPAPQASPEHAPTTATPPGGFAPPAVAELAQRFPHLEILELLGRGGMGAVYKARQPGLDRRVALKVLPPEVGRDPAFAERFQREARALARLSHPHIVAVYDFGQSDGLYYFVMEYVEGATLRQMVAGGELTAEHALAIVPQVCEALQYAHDEGIVHRDIKPENILLDRKGRVKIADFGLAKLLAPDAADRALTGTHQVMGTLHYMAPEQFEGSHQVDHRADIYSLGVVFYELLTGELPLGRFPPPSKKVEIDVRLDEVVLRALEREPEQRYQHASEVKSDVETIRESPAAPSAAVQAVAEAPVSKSAPAQLRNPAAGLLLAGAATALLSLATAVWLGAMLARIHSTPADDQVVKNGEMTITYHPSPWRPYLPALWTLFVVQVLGAGAGGIIVLGALTIPRLQSRPLAVAAAGLAMAPLSAAWPIACALGLWALVRLNRPPIRRAFAAAAEDAGEPADGQTVSLAEGFSRLMWVAVACALLGVVGGLLPWSHANFFGVSITLMGVDGWMGQLVTGLLAALALGVLAMGLFRVGSRWSGAVVLLGGTAAAITLGAVLQQFSAGLQITTSEAKVSGDAGLASEGLVDSLRSLATTIVGSGITERPGIGLWITLASCAALLVVGMWLVVGRTQAAETAAVAGKAEEPASTHAATAI